MEFINNIQVFFLTELFKFFTRIYKYYFINIRRGLAVIARFKTPQKEKMNYTKKKH